MTSLPIYSLDNKQVGESDFPQRFLGEESASDGSVVHQIVVMQRASQRQGTASTKGRGDVSGSGKKPWKQKHTGRARSGSVRSPIWRHGGIAFGPKPRSYGFKVPRKMYRAAMKAAIRAKCVSGDVIVVDDIRVEELKTKNLQRALEALGVKRKAILVVSPTTPSSGNLFQVARNLRDIDITWSYELNVYDVVRCDKIVATKDALDNVQEIWG